MASTEIIDLISICLDWYDFQLLNNLRLKRRGLRRYSWTVDRRERFEKIIKLATEQVQKYLHPGEKEITVSEYCHCRDIALEAIKSDEILVHWEKYDERVKPTLSSAPKGIG